jgi:hypothetical protein
MVDGKQSRLFYGDPFGSQRDPETEKVLEWWTHHHTGRRFLWGILEVPTQKDSFNCGILSHSGLSHHFLPSTPLFNSNGKGPVDARLEMMLRVINKHVDVSVELLNWLLLMSRIKALYQEEIKLATAVELSMNNKEPNHMLKFSVGNEPAHMVRITG